MRKEASGRTKEMAPKVAKPTVLSAEAAAMEQKLVELRKAMEKERAKREALMANTGGGSIWRNGGSSGGLRTNVKGKGPGEGSAHDAPARTGDISTQRPASGVVHSGPGLGSPAAPRASSARSAGTTLESEIPAVSGSRLTSTRPAIGGPSEIKGGISSGAVGRVAPGSSSDTVGGMSCGTDDNSSLADGAFSEADSHRSFLEALNEWRRANRGDAEASGEGQAAPGATSTSGSGGALQRPRSARQSATLEVQTDSRPSSRPSSAKPLSYFDKLVINASSRVAGHLASGGPPETLNAPPARQTSGLKRPSSASRPPVPPGSSAGFLSTPNATATVTESSSKSLSAAADTITTATSANSASGAAGGSNGDKAALTDALSILDRLEELERQRQAAAEDDEDEDVVIQVTTAAGLVLTKGIRLPDEVLMAPNEGF